MSERELCGLGSRVSPIYYYVMVLVTLPHKSRQPKEPKKANPATIVMFLTVGARLRNRGYRSRGRCISRATGCRSGSSGRGRG